MADAELNVRDLVERLWDSSDPADAEGAPVVPPLPDFLSPEHDGDLRFVNTHWEIDPTPDGPQPESDLRAKAKSRMTGTMLSILSRYFGQERDFFAHLVRTLNTQAGWSARHARELRVIAEALNDESHRQREHHEALRRRLEVRLDELEKRLSDVEDRSR